MKQKFHCLLTLIVICVCSVESHHPDYRRVYMAPMYRPDYDNHAFNVRITSLLSAVQIRSSYGTVTFRNYVVSALLHL